LKAVQLSGVQKTYAGSADRADVAAVKGVDLSIAAGEFFILLGASGSGKTTLLRCIAGLESITGGQIQIGDAVVATVGKSAPAVKRNIGMVFQDYAIWPHMTVAQNVEFALRHARSGALRHEAARKRVAEVLDVVGLAELADRGATYLSGGQQQRVALARAVVAQPDLLLFDEPLSNLDSRLRALMRIELKRIASGLGITSVYVTHDQVEALVMADHIAVMREGRVIQVGTPEEIYRQPADVFVAGFIGEANLVAGTVVSVAGTSAGTVTIDTELGRLWACHTHVLNVGDEVTLVIRPENLHLGTRHTRELDGTEPTNATTGKVISSTFAGAHTDLVLACGGIELNAQVHSFEPVAVDSEVTLTFGARWTVAVPAASPAN
jgi:ABC-type Fe3+/spermidine/putrescine transport system ATPase subunit